MWVWVWVWLCLYSYNMLIIVSCASVCAAHIARVHTLFTPHHTQITKPIKRPFRNILRFLQKRKINLFFTVFRHSSIQITIFNLLSNLNFQLFFQIIFFRFFVRPSNVCIAEKWNCRKDDEIYAFTDETWMHHIGNNSRGKSIWISVAERQTLT